MGDLMSIDDNWNNFRLAWSRVRAPCVPYIGVALKDLIFTDDGTPLKLEGDIYNFSKLRKLYTTILGVARFQSTPYDESGVKSEWIQYLRELHHFSEKTLEKLSLEAEPSQSRAPKTKALYEVGK